MTAYFNTTGTVNGTILGYGYQKFSATTNGVVASAYDWSLFLNTSTDSDNNPNTFNTIWSWNSGGTETGLLTFLDTDPSKPGPEEWSEYYTRIQASPLIPDGPDPDNLPDGFVVRDFQGNVLNVPLTWQVKDSNNVIATFSASGKDQQNNSIIFSGSLKDTNNDNLPDHVHGSWGSIAFDYDCILIDSNSDGTPDQVGLIITGIRSGPVQVDDSGHPAGIYLGISTSTDNTPPTISIYAPENGATGIPVDGNIVFTFNEMIGRGTGTIAIHSGSATGPIVESFDAANSVNLSVLGTTLTINPTADLSSGNLFYVTFDNGSVKDFAGNNYAGTTTYDFTTGSGNSHLNVTSFSPIDGLTQVAIGTNIVLTFNETIQRGIGKVELHLGSPSGPVVESYNVETSSNLSITSNTLTINPTSDLSSNTHYFVTLSNGSIKDFDGNSYVGTTSYDFTTAPADDLTPPVISTIRAYDLDHNGGYSAGDRLIFSFSDPVSIDLLHTLTGDKIALPAGRYISSTSESIPLDPVNGFASQYMIYFDTGVNILAGDTMTLPKTYIQNAAGHDAANNITFTLPSLLSTQPTTMISGSIVAYDNDNNHVYNSGDLLILTFSEAVNVDLVLNNPAGDPYALPAGEGNNGEGQAVNEINGYASQFKVYLAPGGSLHAGDTLTILKGNVMDAAGNFASNNVTFTLPSLITDTISPTVTSFNPVDEAIRVPVGNNIAITFSEAIQLGNGHIILETSSGSVVETYTLGSSNVTINGNVLTINPTYNLANSTGYKLDIEHDAVMDLVGNQYAGTTSYNFTTVGLTSSEAILERAYIAYFGRAAEPEGFNWWLSTVSSQGGIDAVMTNVYRDFCKSSEYLRAYASDLDPFTHAVINAPHLLNSIYENLFHRDIEQGGLDYWGTLVSQGAVTINSVVVEVLNGARNSDFDAVNSKIDAAIALTHKVDEINASGYAGDNAAHVAHDWLSGIYDASTLDAALVNASLTAAAEQIIAAGTQVSLVGVLAA